MRDDYLEFDFYSGCIEDLNEALRKYISYIESGNKLELRHSIKAAAESYALAILYILDSHGISILTKKHETIKFDESIKCLDRDLKIKIEHQDEVENLKKIRNKFVHNRYSIHTQSVTNLLDKFMYSLILIFKDFELNLLDMIDEEYRPFMVKRSEYYQILIEENKLPIHKDNYLEIQCNLTRCPFCGEEDSFVLTDNENYWCVFCNTKEDAKRCDDCRNIYPESEMRSLARDYENYCPDCYCFYISRFD